ncbi:MAG: hypothetical protein LUD72_03520 [Bacteroidales bacterium]|nr:hypothetical protein [Bacteroidales bacterium]
MAYTMEFKTLWGNVCEVVVTPAGGGEGTLIPSSEPFEMETDDSADIDTVLRATTGTLRFIVPEGGEDVLSAILPDTLLGTRVEVYLTDAETGVRSCKFQGYVEANDYSQPWDSAPFEMELTVRDAVSLCQDMSMEIDDEADYGGHHNLAHYMVEMMDAMGLPPSRAVLIVTASNIDSSYFYFWQQFVCRGWFVEEGTDSEGYPERHGMSWSDVWRKVLLPYAMEMWTDGDTLYLRQSGGTMYLDLDWGESYNSAPSVRYTGTLGRPVELFGMSYNSVSLAPLSGAMRIMGDDNTLGWTPVYGRVMVTQSLDESPMFEMDSKWVKSRKLVSLYKEEETGYVWTYESGQPGMTVRRSYGSGMTELSTSNLIEEKYGSDCVNGGVLGSSGGISTGDMPYQSSLPSTEVAGVYMAKYTSSLSQSQAWGMEIISPNVVAPSKSAVICIKGLVRYVRASQSLTYGSHTSTKAVSSGPFSDYGGGIVWASLGASDGYGIVYYYRPDTGEWARGENYFYLYFGTDGELIGANVDAEVTFKLNSDNYCTWKCGSLWNYNDRVRYKDGGQYYVKISTFPGTMMRNITLRVCAVKDGGDVYAKFMDNCNLMVVVGDLKLTWNPLDVSGDIPLPTSTSLSISSLNVTLDTLPDKTTASYRTGGSGVEAGIELDTWNDGDGGQCGNTLQPPLPVWNGGMSATQWGHCREIVDIGEARVVDGGFMLTQYYRQEGGEWKWYVWNGGGWKAWNEGGRKRLVEVL